MKFKDMKYERPDMNAVQKEMQEYLEQMKQAQDAKTFMEPFWKVIECESHFATSATLCAIRHTMNTADAFYEAEQNYMDENSPVFQALDNQFVKITLEKPFRKDLLKEIPETFFQLGECALKSFDDSIVPLLIEENKLCTQYGKLKAGANIPFHGEVLNLAQIAAKQESTDREIRKEATNAKMAFYEEHSDEFDKIYDELVHVREKMAKQLGYQNYVTLGYYRMNRIDYDAKMVEGYRKQILDYVTPEAEKLIEKQRQRLGLKEMAYYDTPLLFPNGNPQPKGSAEDLVNDAVQMYHEMSPETGSFIDMMKENELWDLISRPNKEMGGYMTSILDYKVPFIFSNFNGTSADVNVLTHEAGHAFQGYMSRDIKIPTMQEPTMESCEIHSMSMEFFAHPWFELFFKDEADAYRYMHICSTITFLPYGVLVDHFQQDVYENPDWTPKQRREDWRKLEKMYEPYKNYDGCAFLEEGGWWVQQNHIFQSPFYYIDYTLAQVCAQQFFLRIEKKDPEAWKDYIHLCKLGGTLSFTKLVKEAGLKSPFESSCIPNIVKDFDTILEKSKF